MERNAEFLPCVVRYDSRFDGSDAEFAGRQQAKPAAMAQGGAHECRQIVRCVDHGQISRCCCLTVSTARQVRLSLVTHCLPMGFLTGKAEHFVGATAEGGGAGDLPAVRYAVCPYVPLRLQFGAASVVQIGVLARHLALRRHRGDEAAPGYRAR